MRQEGFGRWFRVKRLASARAAQVPVLAQVVTASQQASSDERLLNFSQGGRVQIHLGNGLLDQPTSDGEPLFSGCRCGPFSEAIKDGTFSADAVKNICHQFGKTSFYAKILSNEKDGLKALTQMNSKLSEVRSGAPLRMAMMPPSPNPLSAPFSLK